MSEETNDKDIVKNRVKNFDELMKEVKASWSDEAWMVYESASKAFQEDMKKDKSKNNG